MYSFVLPVFVLLVINLEISYAMARPQLKKAMGIMKNSCMTKNDVTDDDVGKIEQGVFIKDHNVMCYMACIYKSLQLIKNDRINKDLVIKQIDLLYPPEMKDATKEGIEKCMPVQEKYADSCEGVFHAAKCLYDHDPANFVFP